MIALPSRLNAPAPMAAFLVLAVAAATIAGAWGFQLIGGFVPCHLCLEERIPYYVGVPFALATSIAALALGDSRIIRFLLLALALVFAVGAGLGVYHAGVEWGWWLGPSDCGATAPPGTSITDLMNQVKNIRVVSCTEASWRFLGLSFAGWNAVVSALLVLAAARGALSRRAA